MYDIPLIENAVHRLNLSHYAWNIIYSDWDQFNNETPQGSTGEKLTITGFLNTIFLNYWEESPANLQHNLNMMQQKYPFAMNKDFIALYKDTLIQTYIAPYEKGRAMELRLRNRSLELIQQLRYDDLNYILYENVAEPPANARSESDIQRHIDRQRYKCGRILKGLFETYCRLPYCERELIFFKDAVDEINRSIELSRALMVKASTGIDYHFVPDKIITDASSNYNYLIGFARALTPDASSEVSCMRISRLLSVKTDYKTKASLSWEEKNDINEVIVEKGVQFITNDMITAKIKLTDKGMRQYANILHLRPAYTKKLGDNTLEFRATEAQLKFYFFKFGEDAEILEPKSLRDDFKGMYERACRNYE